MKPDFRQYAMNSLKDLEPFIKYDPPRYLEFTRTLSDRVNALPLGGTLYVTQCVPPLQYNLCVKWFCWMAFMSHHVSFGKKNAVLLDILPDYSGITKHLRT